MIIDFKNFNINVLYPTTDFQKEVKIFLEQWFSAAETVDVSTSGSTGEPKILQIQKKKMSNSAKMTCDFFNLKEGDQAVLCLPTSYISGKMMVVRAIERKLKILIVDPSQNPIKQLEDRIGFCAMTPLQVENSLNEIHLIKNLIIGGAQVSENLKQKIHATLKGSGSECKIYETYGMSETLSHIALKQLHPVEEEYFTVLNGVFIATDARNCLKIDAPLLNDDVLQTNDVVELFNGNQFKFLGRTDFVINSGGVKIFPENLENHVKKILAKSGIENEVIFAGEKDEVLGEKLVLIIEGKYDSNIINSIKLISFAKNFHRPKDIIFKEKFSRSPNGKILRKEILK